MKNKKISKYFLILNLISASLINANSSSMNERLYDKIATNIENGNSNNKNYKLLESILKNKNKELKDLYLQNTYIVKPEFLEWQIFFSTSYIESKNSDNTYENAKYSSEEPEGYFDANGTYTVTGKYNTKPYKPKQQEKSIDLGVSIPLKRINRESLNLNVNPIIKIPSISYIQTDIELDPLSISTADLIDFNPKAPQVNPVSLPPITISTPSLMTYDSYGGDTLIGKSFSDIDQGTYRLSDVEGKKSLSGLTATRDNAIMDFGYTKQSVNDTEFSSHKNSEMIVDVEKRRGVALDASKPLTFKNNGKIILKSVETTGLEIQTGGPFMEVQNTEDGRILGENNNQSAMMYTVEDGNTIRGNHIGSFLNMGLIEMSGDNSTGIVINAGKLEITGTGTQTLIVKNNGMININGEQSYGIVLGRNSVIKADSEMLNDIDGIINLKGNKSGGIVIQSSIGTNNVLNKGTINISSENSFGIYSNISDQLENEGKIYLNESKESIGLRSSGGFLNNTTGTIEIKEGNDNIGLYSSAGGTVENSGSINVKGGINNTAVMVDGNGAKGKNTGSIIVEGSKLNGIIAMNNANFENTGYLTIKGENSTGLIAQDGTIKAGTVTMDLSGKDAIGAYAGGNSTSTIDITGGNVNLKNGGVNFSSGKSGILNLRDTNFITGEKSLGFYSINGGKINIQNLEGTIKGSTSSSDRGSAFYMNGNELGMTDISSVSDIQTLLTASGITINGLKLNMEDGSRLFSLGEVNFNLSAVNEINTSGISTMTVTGNNYKTALLHKSLLNIDQDVNLDDENSDYFKIELANSSINNTSIITGNLTNQIAVSQGNSIGSAKNTVTLENNGTIKLKGSESVAIYTDNGIIKNNNIIETTGNKSYGIYGVNGTEVITGVNSVISSGSNGAGIVLQSHILDSSGIVVNKSGGDGTFKLDHDGTILGTGEKIFGIYADNNDSGLMSGTRVVNLNTGSMVDLSKTTDKGTGVYVNKTILNTSGDIKAGINGLGIYSKDSKINLNGGTIELSEDNSTGVFLDGNSNLTVTDGTIRVKGNNTTIFVIGSQSVFSGLENIKLNLDPNVKLTFANVKDNNFTYNGELKGFGADSVLVLGENSSVNYGTGAEITSTKENITGLAGINGGSASNKGKISLSGEESIGIYTKNSDVFNEGTLKLGNKGIGIYNEGSIIKNISGKIETGTNGVGILGVNSTNISNNTLINGSGDSTIGIYAVGDAVDTKVINNTLGKINLTGDKSIGIYVTGTKAKEVENDGAINVGNSTEMNNPNIGIYNNITGSIINNNGNIRAGENSIGIYNKGGTVTESGMLEIGNKGTGIYSDNGLTTINSVLLKIGTNEAVGIYGVNNAEIINNSANISIGSGSYGFVLESGSNLTNRGSVSLTDNNVFVYGNGAGIIKSFDSTLLTASGSNNIIFYTINGGNILNDSSITVDNGTGNIAIYNNGGSITNTGNISIGNSELSYNGGIVSVENSKYSVGLYGENSIIKNSGNLNIGENAIGIYVKENLVRAENRGKITAGTKLNPKAGAIGILVEGGKGIENFADITLYGKGVIGIAGKNAEKIINRGVITVEGENAVGIYGTNTEIENHGIINVSGNNGVGIVSPMGKLINKGTINFSDGASMNKDLSSYELPELINMGQINVNGHFDNTGMEISIKPNLDTLISSNIPDVDFELSSGSISANSITITDTVKILPDFSQGTNAKVYKLKNVFLLNGGNINSLTGEIPVLSKSLTWEAIPTINEDGNMDIYMKKIDYNYFTEGFWYEEFGQVLDNKYSDSTGDAGKIFDKIDLIEHEKDFRNVMEGLAGNIYSNINQRENDISRTFETSLNFLENSENSTKENVKINIISGKGKTKEDTAGTVNYDYTTTGILALREVERTYNHKFAYSLGYLHTGFKFKDGNESEETVNTVQLGLHNSYKSNGWNLRNNLTGRASIHNMDRNLDWPSPTGRSEMSAAYETYSITSDNILGKEFLLGKNIGIVPYGALRAMYVVRPTFSEKGLEALEIEGNNLWSVKPRLGVELNGKIPLGRSSIWKLSGNLDIAYEYELSGLNKREHAKLTAVEDRYHKLSKSEDEKGKIRTKVSLGIEAEERYGIFLTGEYGVRNNDVNDYRAGVTLKAIF